MARWALLLLTGGRIVPDFLVLKYLRPEVAFNLTTRQGLATAQDLKEIAWAELACEVEILPTVDPYKEDEIKNACLEVLGYKSKANWIISMTSAPKILSIFAMDLAREKNIPCWFLNTDDGKVISLARDIPVNNKKLFNITVDQYIKACKREHSIVQNEHYRKLAESWYDVAYLLAHAPEETHMFLKALRLGQRGIPRGDSVPLTISAQVRPLVQELQAHGVLTIDGETTDALHCSIRNGDWREFLNGTWLEVYVWKEIEKAGFAQDCQWGYRLTGQAKSELDVAFTYRGLLLVAECKTDDDPFTQKREVYLDTLNTTANLLGQSYVSKFFILSHPAPEAIDSYASFNAQAHQRGIFIITGKQLQEVGAILREQAKNPRYERK